MQALLVVKLLGVLGNRTDGEACDGARHNAYLGMNVASPSQ